MKTKLSDLLSAYDKKELENCVYNNLVKHADNPNINRSKDYGWVFPVFMLIVAIISYLIW